ncbi:Radial spoke 3 like protein [Aduncisulcus paluster]|uniref:Radial spoke 3 like protein n=1 Tax=Aduncisulcus paluster TaxID=2918883 RepID=A0ABQ5K5V4_9EUKA|nr:Radial spoke 3 like protein [Aduncisulcus paluster]
MLASRRCFVEVQTDQYIEDLTEVIPDKNVSCQTDPFLDRPVEPKFIPEKRGIDKSTEILPGDLFDFDEAVEPLLDLLVTHTCEVAFVKVIEEAEMKQMREAKERFRKLQQEERIAVRRLEEAESRRKEETMQVLAQNKARREKEEALAHKTKCDEFARHYTRDLIEDAMGHLDRGGFFHDPIARTVETTMIPWLADTVERKVKEMSVARNLVDHLIMHAIRKKLK